jgi:DNA repair protein RecN (Recombination protein N)
MLQYLSIKNLALVEEMTLEFDPGFVAITGETGAGKSVLLGALMALAGGRIERIQIRNGADTLELEAALYLPSQHDALNRFLEKAGLPSCEEDMLILHRSLSRQKGGRVQINGRLAALSTLQELSEYWIDFHGPGESQKLLSEVWQLNLLDSFAGETVSSRAYEGAYKVWTELKHKHEVLMAEPPLDEEGLKELQALIHRIDQLDLSAEGIAELEQQFNRWNQSQGLVEKSGQISEYIQGSQGALRRLQLALPVARQLAQLDQPLNNLSVRLESAILELTDLAAEYEASLESCQLSPLEVQKLQERMEQWLQLKRKYGPDLESVQRRKQAFKEQLARQSNLEKLTIESSMALEKAERSLRLLGERWHSDRLVVADTLSMRTEETLRQLGFSKARLRVELSQSPALMATGLTLCSIHFSANPGQPLLPLNKIASSGEMARVLLALKTILARADATPVLVFDEVDANVGGEVATTVARLLGELGERHHVFCVTHLPQVAARAAVHYQIHKEFVDEHTTRISIRRLDALPTDRVGELARMLGDRHSSAALQHARELLNLPMEGVRA